MKNFLLAICAVICLISSACSSSGSIDKAFDLVQDNASYEKVFDQIKPILDAGNIDQLSMEEKCKLLVSWMYINSNIMKSFDPTKDENPMDNKVMSYVIKNADKLKVLDNLSQEALESSNYQRVFEGMTGTAKRIVNDFILTEYDY